MKRTNSIEREINKIRLAIHEETKNMTPTQLTEYYRKSGEAAAQKYGFRRVVTANQQTNAV